MKKPKLRGSERLTNSYISQLSGIHSASMYFSGDSHQTGSQWIAANLSITGFSEDFAAFMTVKELVENSIDASAAVGTPVLSLHIERCSDFLEVSCTDNGNGFGVDSVEALTQVFTSSRVSTPVSSVGKFGIGLKAMAMLSHLKCNGRRVSVSSGIRGTSTCVSFELGIDQCGEVAISQAALVDCNEDSCSTRVTVASPQPPDFEEFKRGVIDYLTELTRARPSVTVSLGFNDEEPEPIRVEESDSKPVLFSDPSETVTCSVCVICKSARRSTEDARIRLVRSVNGVPLITQNSAGCILRQASMAAIVKSSASMGIDVESASVDDSVVFSSLKVKSTPLDSSWSEVVIRVDARLASSDVEYVCLSKNGIVGSKTQSVTAALVGRAVRTALRRTQARFRAQFLSSEAFEHKMAISKHIPVIARHLTEVSSRISDAGIRAKIASLFDIQGDRESDLKSKLLTTLNSSTVQLCD